MPKHSVFELMPGSTWQHVASGAFYRVEGVAICATNGERDGKEQSVIYRRVVAPHLAYYREVSEFLDGRFEPKDWVADSGKKETGPECSQEGQGDSGQGSEAPPGG